MWEVTFETHKLASGVMTVFTLGESGGGCVTSLINVLDVIQLHT